jgi:excisionase family DNA binding protein
MARLRDAAASVGTSEAFIRNEIKAGRLEARRAGRAVLIPVDELRRWADDLPPAA